MNKKTGGADLNKFAYAYDNRDVRTGVQMKYGADPLRQVDYSYDAVDQLVGEAATGGVAGTTYSNAYSYDAMGNRLRRENTQGTTTAMTRSGVNALNQLTSVSTSIDGGPRVTGGMSYDAAGNLTETTGVGGARTLYVYDDADRLFRIEKRNAADAPLSKSEFIYDYASRKSVSQEFTFTAGAWVKNSEKRRVFDGLDVMQERNSDNEVTAQLVRDGNIGGILSRSTSVGASFFGYDGGGNVTLLSDASGNEVGRYRYDAFGNTLEMSGSRAADNPYRFSTKELHAQSGLYDFGLRFYSAGLGRWINRDPISEAGGLNLYAMAGNNPANAVDEYGLAVPIVVGVAVVVVRVAPIIVRVGPVLARAAAGLGAASAAANTFAQRFGPAMVNSFQRFNWTLPQLGFRYGASGGLTRPTGAQANHLFQNRAFCNWVPHSQGFSHWLGGQARTAGTPHNLFHARMDQFWQPYRSGGLLYRQFPTIGQYNRAAYDALRQSGYKADGATRLLNQGWEYTQRVARLRGNPINSNTQFTHIPARAH